MDGNVFNPPDQDHSGHTNFKTLLADIATLTELGYIFNGRFKREMYGDRCHLKYYVTHECGCASYRTMHSMKRGKGNICGNCTQEDNTRKVMYRKRNAHVKRISFYEDFLIKGAKILDVVHKADNIGRKYYKLEIKCACGEITYRRPGDLVRYKNEKTKEKTHAACKLCGTFIGMNYGDYAPVKSMIKRLEKEIQDVESGRS